MSKKKTKLLVCVSQNEHCLGALKYAALKAKKNNSLIEILTVIDTTGKDYNLFSVGEVIKREKLANSENFIKDISSKVYEWSSGITPIINIKKGYISDEIANTIESDKAISLVVIGSSPESTSKGKLLNYLTEKIYSKLFIPMIIIPNSLTNLQIEQIT